MGGESVVMLSGKDFAVEYAKEVYIDDAIEAMLLPNTTYKFTLSLI